GWTGDGEWLNFTRTFPPGRYYVSGRLASDLGACGTENARLEFVTSDPTQPSQTTKLIGEWHNPSSAGWDAMHTVPLLDGVGNLATVKLGGLQTVRWTKLPGGCADVNWIAFTPAPPQRSRLASWSPPISREWPNPYAPAVTANINEEDTPVAASSVHLWVDGVDRTA